MLLVIPSSTILWGCCLALMMTTLFQPIWSSNEVEPLLDVQQQRQQQQQQQAFNTVLAMLFPSNITNASDQELQTIFDIVQTTYQELQTRHLPAVEEEKGEGQDSNQFLCDPYSRTITHVNGIRIGSHGLYDNSNNKNDDNDDDDDNNIPLWMWNAMTPRTVTSTTTTTTTTSIITNNNDNHHHHRLRNRKLVLGLLKPNWYQEFWDDYHDPNVTEFRDMLLLLQGTCVNCLSDTKMLFFTKEPNSVMDDETDGLCQERSPYLNTEFRHLVNTHLLWQSPFGPVVVAHEEDMDDVVAMDDPASFRTVEGCDACPVETTSCSYNYECSWAQCVDNNNGCFEDEHCRDPCQECNCDTAQCQPIQGCCTRNDDCNNDNDNEDYYCFTGSSGCLDDTFLHTCVECRNDDDCNEDRCHECDCNTGQCVWINNCCYKDRHCDNDEICSVADSQHCSYHTCIEDDEDSCEEDDDCYCGNCDCEGHCKKKEDCCEEDDDCKKNEICPTKDSTTSCFYHECTSPCTSSDNQDCCISDDECNDTCHTGECDCSESRCRWKSGCCEKQEHCDDGFYCDSQKHRCVECSCGECETCTEDGCVIITCGDCEVCAEGDCVAVTCEEDEECETDEYGNPVCVAICDCVDVCEECQDGHCVEITCSDACDHCQDGECIPITCDDICAECQGGICVPITCDDVCAECQDGTCAPITCDDVCTECQDGICVPITCDDECKVCVAGICRPEDADGRLVCADDEENGDEENADNEKNDEENADEKDADDNTVNKDD